MQNFSNRRLCCSAIAAGFALATAGTGGDTPALRRLTLTVLQRREGWKVEERMQHHVKLDLALGKCRISYGVC